MRILITGGAGYLGTELVKILNQQPEVEEIVVYDNLSRTNYNFFLGTRMAHPQKVRLVRGELLDSRQLRKSLQGMDVVYHLAANVTTPFANTDSHFFEQVNHWGTAELVYAIEESDVKRLIYTSSASVYGSSKKQVEEGQEALNPRTFYGISKMRGEQHVQRLMDKKETFVLRLGNVYGYSKSMRFDSVINRFMFDAHTSGRISIHGDGKQSRAFIHIDVVATLLGQLAGAKAPGGIYNVVDRNMQILDIVDVLKEIYPALEFIFVNQHLKLRQMKVSPESALRKYVAYDNPRTLQQELKAFSEKFSY
jgi:UDP-glucose 4-epimerase